MNSIVLIIVAIFSLSLTTILGFWLIPVLKRLNFGQTINNIGPVWHKSKQGTPTMGGFLLIIGITVSSIVGITTLYLIGSKDIASASIPMIDKMNKVKLFAGIGMALGFAFIGFVDDYIKVVKKRNLGLDEKQKLIMQTIVTVLYLLAIYLSGDHNTTFMIPFIGSFNFGILYYLIAGLYIIYFVNAVNLTDGVDGLLGSSAFITAVGFIILSAIMGNAEMGILSTALAAGCIGFLIWNFYPAKLFMGDTGSMFLGGIVVAIAFGLGMPLILILTGIIYLCEALSVVVQVVYFKLTHGKRLFKMTPIHHSFEMSGYSEVGIVIIFSIIGVIGIALALLSVVIA